jgi:hypothetical protein
MLGGGVFGSQLNAVEAVLRRLELLESRNPSPNYSRGASHFRQMSYREVWEEYFKTYNYDFLLVDQSLLTFEMDGQNERDGQLRYAYYECPYTLKSFDEYCLEFVGGNGPWRDGWIELEDLLRDEYAEYIVQCDATGPVTPIRYDYQASDYRPGGHPASHVHFGHKSNIRVATRRVMLPVSFVLLIVRQVYPERWSRLLSWGDSSQLCRNVRDALEPVNNDYWKQDDMNELFLH